jgi:putative ABC transport system substrate-binding protein
VRVPVANPTEIIAEVGDLAAVPGSGLIVGPDDFMWSARSIVIDSVSRHPLPAVYPFADYTREGGLMSHSIDLSALFERAGGYVGRILGGEDPAVLPLQSPLRFRLVVNLEAAARQGLSVPVSLIAIADEVTE